MEPKHAWVLKPEALEGANDDGWVGCSFLLERPRGRGSVSEDLRLPAAGVVPLLGRRALDRDKLNGKEEAAIKKASKYQEDVQTDNKASMALWIILSIALVGTIGGVAVCKSKKTCCFAEKDHVSANEGGESDKTLFKREVKSKKSKKKLAKESLMPAFNVVDQA